MNGEMAKGAGIGLLIGAAVGAVVGLLYAPHSGRITRSLIKERSDEAMARAEMIVNDARKRAEDIIRDARTKVIR